MEVYDYLCELGKTNDSFVKIVDKLFRDNNLLGVVTTEENEQ